MSETRRFGEWDLTVNDQAHDWQGSLAGDSGMEGLGSVTTQLSDWAGAPGIQLDSMTLQSGVEPDQSNLSVRSSRVSKTALGEVDRRLGARNVATAAGFTVRCIFTFGLDRRHRGGNAGRLMSVYCLRATGWADVRVYELDTSGSNRLSHPMVGAVREITIRAPGTEIGAGPSTWRARGARQLIPT